MQWCRLRLRKAHNFDHQIIWGKMMMMMMKANQIVLIRRSKRLIESRNRFQQQILHSRRAHGSTQRLKFVLFLRIIMKYLSLNDPRLHQQALMASADCIGITMNFYHSIFVIIVSFAFLHRLCKDGNGMYKKSAWWIHQERSSPVCNNSSLICLDWTWTLGSVQFSFGTLCCFYHEHLNLFW